MKIECFSPKQLLTMTWWSDSSAYHEKEAIICDGAVRSGKTLCLGLSFFCWAMRRFHGQQFGICGKTIVSLRRNVVATLLPILKDLGFTYEEKLTKNEIIVRFGGKENRFHLFGGKDESSASFIQGSTFAGVLLDEVALMPRSFVEQAMARCSVTDSKIWFNCNPEGAWHWFYKEWIRKAEERNALYIHFTMEDNPSLSRKIIRRYQRMYSGIFYRRFVLGEWVAAQGRVYDFFDESYVKAVPEGPFEHYVISCDYGTSNPSSFGLWALQRGVWYRIREYYYEARRVGIQKTDAEYVQEMIRLADGLPIRMVVADPSASSFIAALRQAGFTVMKAENSVLSGIRKTADMLKNGEIVICEGCKGAIEEFSMYCWDESRQDGQDAPKKIHDHAMDEIRYFVSTVAASQGTSIAVCSVQRQ